MAKNYPFLFLLLLIGFQSALTGQEIKIFTTTDFDLKGSVKSCLVSTNYGKEEYDFNKEGLLTKSITRYNDSDYDITYYKYEHGELIEKRLENYRENTFYSATSIANFYEIDTTENRKVTEKIVSYDKEFLDQYEYVYDFEGRLEQIIRTNNDGTDETKIEYSSYKGEDTKTFYLNGVILQSMRTSQKKKKNGSVLRVVLTKKFLDGEPNSAVEEVFDAEDKRLSQTEFLYDMEAKQFAPTKIIGYTYDKLGMLAKTETKIGEVTETKEYIYQFDNGESGNWVKQIIIPDNSYTTRKIMYYEAPPSPLSEGK